MFFKAMTCCAMFLCLFFAACTMPGAQTPTTDSSTWIPQGCSQVLPSAHLSGYSVQSLRCGHSWRFLAWDADSFHNYHELSAPGRTDCPQGETRDTVARILAHDPYTTTVWYADLLERGDNASGWVASSVSFAGRMQGDLYPPNCPKEQ